MKNRAHVVFASPGGSVIPGTLWAESCASTEETARKPKIGIITIDVLRHLSEIKLKRTDTTLDLSQKAKRAKEKRKRRKRSLNGTRRDFIEEPKGEKKEKGAGNEPDNMLDLENRQIPD
ncbi:hypothetical protein NOF04DRAFT_1268954 [Fusarium oxysporum II5]|nr:hypothetical protein NOF04DRAFT_1268954 [Fusarium oxysporum II5]